MRPSQEHDARSGSPTTRRPGAFGTSGASPTCLSRTAGPWVFALALLGLVGCAGARPIDPRSSVGFTPTAGAGEPETAPPSEPVGDDRLPPDVVARSAMPFHGLAGSRPLAPPELFDELATADFVCVGEHHDDPRHHWAQLQVLGALSVRARSTGRSLALGLEMFQRPFQAALDDYAEGKSTLDELLTRSEWAQRWGFDPALYQPLLERARAERLPIIALNLRQETIRQVARGGVESLETEVYRELPTSDYGDPEHRAAFDAAMKHHPPHGSMDHMYEAQVLWDETMAETAVRFLRSKAPARQLVALAGAAHCRNHAIPSRVERRMPRAKAASVLPVMEAKLPETEHTAGYDYLMVLGAEL